jgi:hypothetical protein
MELATLRSYLIPFLLSVGLLTSPFLSIGHAPCGIDTQPQSQAVCEGSGLVLTVEATGMYLTYQWYRGSDPVGTDSPTLTISNVTAADAGNYTVVVDGSDCDPITSDIAVVTINPLPTITLGSNPTVCQGTTSANLTFSATTENPDQFSIDFEAAAEGQGFIDVTNASLGSSPIVITVPAAGAGGTYNATLTVKNSTTGCVSGSYNITVSINSLDSGSIGSDQTICFGGNPSQLISSIDASGTGAITYQWQRSLDDSFTSYDVVGTGLPTYNPQANSLPTRYYRRRATSTLNSVGCQAFSNIITVTVQNEVFGGTIGSDQCTENDPVAFTDEVSPSGGSATLTYQWWYSASSNFSSPTLISGATDLTYDPPAGLTANRYYRRVTTSTLNSVGCSANSNTLTVNVASITLGSNPTVCGGATSANLPYSATGGSPDQYSIDFDATAEGQGFADVTNASLPSSPISITVPGGAAGGVYNGVLTVRNSSTLCSSPGYSFTVTVNTINPGAVGNPQTICYGGDPSTLTSASAAIAYGTLAYQWERSYDNVNFVDVGGGAATYNPPNGLLQTAYYRREARSTINSVVCRAYSNIVIVTVQDQVGAGAIGSDQTICNGGDPVAFTSVADGSGSGTLTYRWESNTNLGSPSWSVIGGETEATYDVPAGLTVTTQYRRTTISTLNGVVCESSPTATIQVTVQSVPTAGAISGDQTICNGGDPAVFTSTTDGTGDGTISYRWESSVSPYLSWSTIGGATSSTYDPPSGLTTTTQYRRITISTVNSVACESSPTTAIQVTVQTVPVAGSISGDQTICNGGDPASFSSTAPGTGDGTISYRWESSVSPFSSWSTIVGATSATYDPPSGLTATTRYRRYTVSTLNSVACESTATSAVEVTVQGGPTAGAISGAQTICNGGDPAAFTSTTAGTGSGTISYRWESSVSPFTSWSAISGATSATYDAPAGLTVTTQYRRITISSLNGTDCESAPTTTIQVTVQSIPAAGVIAGDQTICSGGNPAAFTSNTPGTGDGAISYRWESSVSPFSSWSTIGGATSSTYDPPSGLTTTTQYRRITISTVNSVACESSPTTAIQVTVQTVPVAGSISGDQTICNGGDPASFSSTAPGTGDGTISYRWESSVSPFSSWSTIVGATSATYDPPSGLTATTRYRRYTVSTLNSVACESTATSAVEVTVQGGPTAGAISGTQTICNGGDPAAFTSTTAGTGSGTISYRWESSVSPFTSWSIIGGATAATYDAPAGLTVTTQYRRITISTLNGVNCESSPTTSLQVTVQSIPTAGAIAGDQTICNGGDPAAFTSTTAGTGSGTITYRWESSVNPFSVWTTISGATSATYNVPAGLTVTTQFRRITVSTQNSVACESLPTGVVQVTVQSAVYGGLVGSDQTICSGGDPAAFTVVDPATGSGTLTYQWQFSTQSNFSSGITTITGATGATYDPPAPLSVNRYYRRITTSTLNGVACTANSNTISVLVNSVTGGTVATNQAFCVGGGNPAAFTQTVASTGAGILSYQWQISNDNFNLNISSIPGATSSTYDEPSVITSTTYYRRVTISTLNGVQCTANSNILTVAINTITPGTLNASQTICNGIDLGLFSNAQAGAATGPTGSTITYQWESSTDNINFNNAVGASSTNRRYDPPALTQTTYYRRLDTSTLFGTACSAYTNTIIITVQQPVNSGSIGFDATICSGTNLGLFASVENGSGSGTITYLWERSIDGGVIFNAIGNSTYADDDNVSITSNAYDPGSLTQTTIFRRRTRSSLNGNNCDAYSNTITVTVNSISSGGTFANQTICAGGTVSLTQANPQASGAGTLSYQWQRSATGLAGSFTDVAGATSATYTVNSTVYSTAYFKRITTSTLNTVACTVESNVVTVTVSGTSGFQSIANGNWSTGSNWSGGSVPGATSGTASCPVIAENDLTLTGPLSVSTGIFKLGNARFSAPGTITVSNGVVTGSGTSFTSGMVGKKIYARNLINYGTADATVGTITSVTNGTQLSIDNEDIDLTSTAYYIGTDVTDPEGGTYHSLTMNRGNSNNIGTNGILDAKSGISNFENGATMQATNLYVRAGATVILGPLKCKVCDPGDPAYDAGLCATAEYNDCRQTRLTTGSASFIYIEKYGRLIVYGNVVNNSQTQPIVTNGLIYVVGTYTSTGTQEIVQEVSGEGDIYTTGSMNTQGNSTVFDFRDVNCGAACSGNALRCGFTSAISPSGQVAFCASLNISLTGTTNAAYTFDMEWEKSTTSASSGFAAISGTEVTISSGTKQSVYPITSNTGSTWYRIRVDGVKTLDGTPCSGYSPPVEIVSGANVWTGGPAAGSYFVNEWHNPANWCNGTLPTNLENVSINPGQAVIIYRKGLDGNTPATTRNLSIFNGATITMQSGAELNIYGNLLASGGALDGSAGTVKFVAGETASVVQGTGTITVNDVEVISGKSLTVYDDINITGNAKFRESGTNVDMRDAKVVFIGTASQSFPGSGLTSDFEVKDIHYEKSSGSVTMNNKVALLRNFTFDAGAAGSVNFNGNFRIESRGSSTLADGKIGPIATNVTIAGNLTAERWMDPAVYAQHRYIAVPVANSPISLLRTQFGTGSRIRIYSNADSRYLIANSLSIGTGYVAETFFRNAAWHVTGSIHKGDYTWTMTKPGWYLIGNPYPAPIRWSNAGDAWQSTNISSTVAVTDNSASAEYPNYFQYYDYTGVDNLSWGNSSLNEGVISMGQAFWVYSNGNGSLTIKEQAKELDIEGKFYRQAGSQNSDALAITLSNGRLRDQAMLKIDIRSKETFEQRYDLEKLFNPEMNISLVNSEQRNLLVHTLSEISETAKIPLAIELSEPGEYSISFGNASNFSYGQSLFLIDSYEGLSIPVNSADAYHFVIKDINRPLNDRFYLSLSSEVVLKQEEMLSVFPNPAKDQVAMRVKALKENSAFEIFDTNGKSIKSGEFSGETIIDISDYRAGVYIFKIRNSRGIFVKKLVKND